MRRIFVLFCAMLFLLVSMTFAIAIASVGETSDHIKAKSEMTKAVFAPKVQAATKMLTLTFATYQKQRLIATVFHWQHKKWKAVRNLGVNSNELRADWRKALFRLHKPTFYEC